ncbi:MAG: phosphoribosylformylglycinamidine synthase [Clostridia bacterium]|nr:phosphoribosylformylglycinamidine synthase [Clostridia bacterium]
MVYRVFVEKKKGLAHEAASVKSDIVSQLMIGGLSDVRLFNRYDVENIEKELFERACKNVFSEPQLDDVYFELPEVGAAAVFAVEYLPGQFDQRADSAAQCIQLISCGERPTVRTAKVYMLFGSLTDEEVNMVKKHLINAVECREAAFELPETLKTETVIPETVDTVEGFISMTDEEIPSFIKKYGLAMDAADVKFCRSYFADEKRDPTITEIRMIDTYWSDHCRHTTFLTKIDSVEFDNEQVQKAYERYIKVRGEIKRTKPINLMDIGTIAGRYLKHTGDLKNVDESEEINACTVKIKANVNGNIEDWLLLFKNETHNHPTEIEPFGGAATCIGGAIRDPLSGRAYVYQAMRVTGAANPLAKTSETIPGKLPQRKIVTAAAQGYSSYGNQIGLATGMVDELYHSGYAAKRMEIGAVVGAAPAENVRRERPIDGDIVILLGGRTGRDGCGGATGSSKSHDLSSLTSCGAEVQKGNAPEERKLQRLFRNKEAARLIKRCNDFGAGGVSVAIGELADGLRINLNAVPKKYEGLDGTELAISESQERMAVVVAKEDVDRFFELAHTENLEATIVAVVTEEKRLVMEWNGKCIVDISREFLNSNGAEKHISVKAAQTEEIKKTVCGNTFAEKYNSLADDLNVCSKRGLSERFDSTIGAGSVLMPFGGKYQLTPTQVMAAKLPVLSGDTTSCSVMAWGYNPFIAEKDPYVSAYLAVVESVSKLVASGAPLDDCYLTFQEYFEKPLTDPKRWGKPFAALLGALDAQLDLKKAAIGGKDSMSGSFEKLDVPPTLVSFAITMGDVNAVISPEFKRIGAQVVLVKPEYKANGIPEINSLNAVYAKVHELIAAKKAVSAYTLTYGGAAEAIMKMCMGNGLGFEYDDAVNEDDIFAYNYGAFILELAEGVSASDVCLTKLGQVTADNTIKYKNESVDTKTLFGIYENKLESVFSCNIPMENKPIINELYTRTQTQKAAVTVSGKPKIAIPVFPGTNCEYDTAKAIERAGGEAEILVIKNLGANDVAQSVEAFAKLIKRSQMIFVPGGFSGGDEPEGSGKFITAFFRNPEITDATHELLKNRDGLMCGVCNGFQALVKLGLVPYGEIRETDISCPTLTYNVIGRHQSRIVRTRVVSNKSPWLYATQPGEVYNVPISHGEGRFICDEELLNQLFENGQVATQYCDLDSNPTYDIAYNPNGSICAVEGITSPDGRVFGKMGHTERVGKSLYKNVEGNYDMGIFDSAVKYFK